jgi:RNA polymerase sigma-70 factor (ECF subfamily)
MSLPSTERDNLIMLCIAGNRKKQKELYDLFASNMYSICLRYSKNQMDAEDILQNGFIKLFTNLNKFRGEGSFEGWVRRIFVNSAIEHIRDKKLTVAIDFVADNSLPLTQTSALVNLYNKDIIKSTNILSVGYRTIFYLYAVEGFTHKEIAKSLGITESTSKSQYSRAKAILRKALASKERVKQEILSAA